MLLLNQILKPILSHINQKIVLLRFISGLFDMEGEPLRVPQVQGYENRCNDVIFCNGGSEANEVVVFFPGDVQDYSEKMQAHRDNKNYIKWSLESTATLLHKKLPKSHIAVIRPLRIEYGTLSVFSNFVPSNSCGVPEHIPCHHSLEHLNAILTNLGKKLELPLVEMDLYLIGFSKGCVVLNQFLHELSEDNSRNFVKIKKMHWLDGGHNGGKDTWITSEKVLSSVVKLGISISVDVTPYQMTDDRRPWIRKEEKQFVEVLKRLGAPPKHNLHFENSPPSIDLHFSVLETFEP